MYVRIFRSRGVGRVRAEGGYSPLRNGEKGPDKMHTYTLKHS